MSSPAFSEKIFLASRTGVVADEGVMTVKGTINKTLILLLLAVLGASYTWRLAYNTMAAETGNIAALTPYMLGGVIGGLVFALIAIFSPRNSRWAAPLYAVAEGLALGAISAIYNLQTQGIVFNAVGLTFLVLLIMLVVYRSGWVKVNDKLRKGIVAATLAVALFYLLTWIISLFMPAIRDFMAGSSPLSIVISLVIVGIAAFNFLMDFDFIEKGAAMGSPKYMEWYAGFGLMLTLVWLYLEILRLLSKVSSRN
ncbi:membrane protein [Bacteroidia bacterium]|nr:membrane protein [Bacteroidia bacterium]